MEMIHKNSNENIIFLVCFFCFLFCIVTANLVRAKAWFVAGPWLSPS